MKIENWNGHDIRFVEKDGEWWAVAKDVTDALGFSVARDGTKRLSEKYKGETKVPTLSGDQKMIILNEKGLYRLIMRSNKKEAEDFQDWVYEVIKTLRESAGLEGFQVFKMLDKEHQKEQMSKLCRSLKNPARIDFIKANTIANKATSIKAGLPKMVKKGEMTPEMLAWREHILEDVVELMTVNDKYRLGVSVSKVIYKS